MGAPYRRNVRAIGFLDFGPSILLLDDHEGSLTWVDKSNPTGTTEKQSTTVFRGSNALHLQSESGTPGLNDTADAERPVVFRPRGKTTLDIVFRVSQAENAYTFAVSFVFFNGTKYESVAISYVPALDKWYYSDVDNAAVELTGITQTLSRDKWHSLQIVFDTVNRNYISITVNDQIQSLTNTAYAFVTDASAIEAILKVIGTLTASATSVIDIYVDEVSIITD